MISKTIEKIHPYYISINNQKLNVISIILGSLFIAILAQISFYIPFSPVPITGQTVGVFIIGGILDRKKGVLCILAYLTEGLVGLPVFANMSAGFLVLIGPTAGYLYSFIPAVVMVGYFTDLNTKNKFWINTFICILVTFFILCLGTLYLSNFIGFQEAFTAGFYPFIVVGVIKSIFSSAMISLYKKYI
mgnify:CR=1 FL=1